MMANLHRPPPKIIIRVDLGGIPSDQATGSDTLRPLFFSPTHPGTEKEDSKMPGWAENRPMSGRARSRGERRRPTSSRSVGRLDSQPLSAGGSRLQDHRPVSSRTVSRLDRRPLSSCLPVCGVNNLTHDSRSSCLLHSKSPSGGSGRRSKRRPKSSRSRNDRSPTTRTNKGPNSRISVNCNGLVFSSDTPQRPQSSGQMRSSSRHSSDCCGQRFKRPQSSSGLGSRSGDFPRPWNEADEKHLSPRSQSSEGRGSMSPTPEGRTESRRRMLKGQGKGEERPRSSHLSGGRVGSASETSRRPGGNRSGTNRPWTAPVSWRGRLPENLHEDGRRTGGGSWWMSPEECSDETKRKQEEIIRRILEEFNLEDTMDRYRNSNTVVIQRHGKSLADFRFRSEMIRMMGSEEIRLNDQDWSRRFNRRLLEDYEKHLDEKENNLAQAERQRVHRLRMEGILHDTEDSPPSTGMDVSISRLPHVSSKKKNRNGRHSVPSAAGIAEEPKRVFAYEQSDKRERTLLTNRQEKIYHPSKDVQTQVARLYTDGEEGNEEEEAEEEGSVNEPDKQKDRLGADVRFERKGHSYLSIGVDEDYEEKMVKRRRKRYQHLPPNVARLYEEETVAGLYQMAAELLSSASPAQEEDQRKEVKIV